MAATINWAQLGVGIPSKFAEKYEPVNMNTDAYVKAGDQINGMFDRWNRENAIGKLLRDKIAAAQEKVNKLLTKRDKLYRELSEATAVPSYEPGVQNDINVDPSRENPAVNYNMFGVEEATV